MGAKFCCCLPVRIGVLILSFLQFLLTGVAACLSWFILIKRSDLLNERLRIVLIALGTIETLAALIALGGFIGAILGRQRGVRVYSWMLNFQFCVLLIWSIIASFTILTRPKSEFINNCINGASDQAVIDACKNAAGFSKPVLIVCIVVGLLVQFWFCWIVAAYASQLREKQALYTRAMMLDTSSEFKYEAARGHSQEALRPLARSEGSSYPYAEPAHSYGNSGLP